MRACHLYMKGRLAVLWGFSPAVHVQQRQSGGKSQNRGDLDCFKIKCYMEMCSEDAGWHRGELFLSACWPE